MTANWRLFSELVDLSGKVHLSPKIPIENILMVSRSIKMVLVELRLWSGSALPLMERLTYSIIRNAGANILDLPGSARSGSQVRSELLHWAEVMPE
jgi:hypothetical protein